MSLLEIQKFGGSSMADAKAVQQSGSVSAQAHKNGNLVLGVVSAMSEVTDQLKKVVKDSFAGKEVYGNSQMLEIGGRHEELIEKVADPKEFNVLRANAQKDFLQAHEYLNAMLTLNTPSPTHIDWFVSLGERLAAPIFAAHLRARGLDAACYDAANVLATDSNFGNANPLIVNTRDRIKGSFVNDLNRRKIVVMGGFHGSDASGNIAALSRGGSDLTATSMAHALTAFFDNIAATLYKADVAGVLSADPRIVPNAHINSHMSYSEAAALTVYGGKVIHPKAVHHAVRSGSSKRAPVPIYVKSTLNPHLEGTLIDNQIREDDPPIKAVSMIRNAVMLTVGGWGMDRSGIMNAITGALAKRAIDIDFIAQPHSKLSLDLAFQYGGDEEALEKAVREALQDPIKASDIDLVKVSRVGVIGVIGHGVSDPYILSRVIQGMNGILKNEKNEPIPFKLTTGEYEASILTSLPEDKLKTLAQSIHDSVFEKAGAAV